MSARVMAHDEIMKRLSKAIGHLRRICEPEFVILFGSYAYGIPHEGSDVDIFIVYPDGVDEAVRCEAGVQMHDAFGKRLQIHPCTLSQWREALLRRNWFVAEIMRKGIPLFSRREWSEVLMEVDKLMSQSENLYPLDWIERAEADWRILEFALGEGLIPEAAYHLQQAVEKWLKAFLLHQGWRLERTHDLEELLGHAIRYEPSLERFSGMCHRVNYFIAARYPGLPNPPTDEELRERWIPLAQQLRIFIRQALKLNE